MINTRNNVNNTNIVNTQEVELTSSVAMLSKRCRSSTYRGEQRMKTLTQRAPAISGTEMDTRDGNLEFINDPALVEQCRTGVRILQYRNRNTEISEEMRRILTTQTRPQRRHTDFVPFSTKENTK